MIDWLFEIGSLKLACKDTTYGGDSYAGAVISDSFSGITVRWDMSGNGLMAPGDLEFDISNADGDYTTSTISESECTVRLIEDGTQIRVWKFRIEHAVEAYGKISCSCVDFLSGYLSGDYPNTPAPTEVWSSDSDDADDDYCIPVVFGTAYIPVRSVNTGSDRYYVLGVSGPTYTVHEVSSPHDWPSSSWSAASYGMDGYTSGGYQLLQPIIMDSDGDDTADACGLWISGRSFLDMLCRFERDDTASLTGPEEVIEYILEDFGVPSGDIDSTSFTAAGVVYTAESVGFDGGGWWEKTPREAVLSEPLAHVDSYLSVTDKVELYQFDATPVETIANALSLSFKPQPITPVETDSGRVHWPESYTKPMDILSGQAIVPTHSGGGEDKPASTVLKCRFFPGGSINAQKAGILYFQKKYEQAQRVSFSTVLTELTTKATLRPGHVITVNNSLYGGSNSVVVTEITIHHDLKTDISGVIMNHLEDWGDLTTSSISVTADASTGERVATTDAQGNIAATWSALLEIPDRFLDSATLGLNATDEYFGYFDGSDFKTYIDSNGNLQCGDPSTGEGFVWNQSTATMTISGSLSIQNPASVRSDLNVQDGATAGAVWGTNLSNIPDFGTLAYKSSIGTTDITSIDGGVIETDSVIDTYSGGYLDLLNSVMWLPYVTPGVNAYIAFGGTSASVAGKIYGGGGNIALLAHDTGDTVSLAIASNFLRYRYSTDLDADGSGSGYTLGPDYNWDNTTYRTCLGRYNTRYWWVYAGAYSAASPSYYYDKIDDLEALHAIRPDANGRVRKTTLPDTVTGIGGVKEKLRMENGSMLTDEDIDEYLEDQGDIGGNLGVNLGEMIFLVEGAVRQLDRESSAVMFEVLDVIGDLRKRVGLLDGK